MSSPVRIQRQRTKGWRMPEGAVYVGRPSLWGNPFAAADARAYSIPMDRRARWLVSRYEAELRHWGMMSDWSYIVSDERWDQEHDRQVASGAANMAEYAAVALRGHDLACWCPLDQPCHADVLLDLANR